MRKVIVGVACLIGIAVLVDFSAAAYAEYRVSRALRAGANLTADPEVTFHGFPFLGQLADGRYRDIQIEANESRPDGVRDSRVEVSLRDVRMPLDHLIDGSVRSVTAGEVDARTWIDSTLLGHLLGIPELQLSTSPADKSDGTGGSGGSGMTTGGAIVLMGTLPVAGEAGIGDAALVGMPRQRVSVEARLVLDGDQLHVIATNLYSGSESGMPDTPVPYQFLPGVLAHFTKVIDIAELPFRLQPTKVTAQGGVIMVEGLEHNMTISLDQLQNLDHSRLS